MHPSRRSFRPFAAAAAAAVLALAAPSGATADRAPRGYVGTVTLSDVALPEPAAPGAVDQLGGRFAFKASFAVRSAVPRGSLRRRLVFPLTGQSTVNRLAYALDWVTCAVGDREERTCAGYEPMNGDSRRESSWKGSASGRIALKRNGDGDGVTTPLELSMRSIGGQGGYALDLSSLFGSRGDRGLAFETLGGTIDGWSVCTDEVEGEHHGPLHMSRETYDNGRSEFARLVDPYTCSGRGEPDAPLGERDRLTIWPADVLWSAETGSVPPLCRRSPLVRNAKRFTGVCGRAKIGRGAIRGSRTITWTNATGCPFAPRRSDGRAELNWVPSASPCLREIRWGRRTTVSWNLRPLR